MRFDKQKAFPYPVLRPSSDDFEKSDFQVTPNINIEKDSTQVELTLFYALSSEEILDQIKKGKAEFVSIISCRDTYFRTVVASSEQEQKINFEIGLLRGEVKIEPFVFVKTSISHFQSDEINIEFGKGPFTYSIGDILAQDEAQVFYIDREYFKPITAVMD